MGGAIYPFLEQTGRVWRIIESNVKERMTYPNPHTFGMEKPTLRYVNGSKVDIPSYRVSESDIIEVRAKSHEMTPFVVARAESGERPAPAWIEVIPDKMRILVHALPVRAQIDTQVQEQLIVEFYSK